MKVAMKCGGIGIAAALHIAPSPRAQFGVSKT